MHDVALFASRVQLLIGLVNLPQFTSLSQFESILVSYKIALPPFGTRVRQDLIEDRLV